MLPIQPIITDENGVERFRANEIVCHLLDNGGVDLNKLCVMDFPQDAREQFAQLIGYTVSGWSELPYVTNDTYKAVQEMKKGKDLRDSRIDALTETLNNVRENLKPVVTELYRIHEDALES